jgi:RNA polymerase sigma-70 factor (ECF subfamily)
MEVDNKIIEGCISGDRLSQHQLYKQLHGMMIRIAFQHTNDRDTAVDYMNVGFCTLLNKVHKYDFKTPFKAWVKVIIKNRIIDEYRKERKHGVMFGVEDIREFTSGSIENEYDYKSSMERVEFLLRGLKEKTKEVIKMQIIEGFTHREIAKMLGISESASKWHLVEGKKYLQKVLVVSI